MKKPGTIISKQAHMEASSKFYFADQYERSARKEENPERARMLQEKSEKLKDEAAKIFGFADYQEFEDFHEAI